MIALATVALALAADPVLDGVRTELDRASQELALPGTPGPYHLSAMVWDDRKVRIEATLGGVVASQEAPTRSLSVVVRTGSEALDNTNFDTFPNGIDSASLVLDPDPMAIRKDAWLVLDQAYKASVEALAAKTAAEQRRAEPDDVPDFAPGIAQQSRSGPAPPFDRDALTTLARHLSAVFEAHPDVEWSRVWIDGDAGRRLSLDTGGTEVIEPVSELVLRVAARARAADGATQVDGLLYVVRSADQLPDPLRLLADAEALCARLERWRSLPRLTDEYVGPVLFEDRAAVELVRQLLAPALIGTPPVGKAASGSRVMVFDGEDDAGPIQPRRRVLPAGYSVDDDPQRDPTRPSAYRYDLEGQPAQAVVLVRDGIVQNHLMSRIPNRWFGASNGHGRAPPGQLVRALPADLAVHPDRTASERAMHKAALKLAAGYGFDHYLVVPALRDPAIQAFSGGPLVRFGGAGDGPGPLEVVAVYRDGREVPMRSAALAGLDLRSFRELEGAGSSTTAEVLMGSVSWFSGPNIGFPVTLTTPDLLFSEVVVSPDRDDAVQPPKLASPLAESRP